MEEVISKELSCAFYIQRAKKFRTKKRLGQNFLINPEIINTIISNVKEDDIVLEIGPGVGFVTEKLVKIAKKVVAVELDEDAVNVLEKNLGGYENFTLILVLLLMVCAVLLWALFIILGDIRNKKETDDFLYLPFGPALVISGLIMAFYQPQMTNFFYSLINIQ